MHTIKTNEVRNTKKSEEGINGKKLQSHKVYYQRFDYKWVGIRVNDIKSQNFKI